MPVCVWVLSFFIYKHSHTHTWSYISAYSLKLYAFNLFESFIIPFYITFFNLSIFFQFSTHPLPFCLLAGKLSTKNPHIFLIQYFHAKRWHILYILIISSALPWSDFQVWVSLYINTHMHKNVAKRSKFKGVL